MILLPFLLLGMAGGGWVAYSQYPVFASVLGGSTNPEEEVEKPIEYGEFMELENMIVNPAGTQGKSYLMIKIGLESPNGSALQEITERQVVVRDTLLNILSTRTVDELSSIELRIEIKQELREAVNRILQKGEVSRLYFTQYVLQG